MCLPIRNFTTISTFVSIVFGVESRGKVFNGHYSSFQFIGTCLTAGGDRQVVV